MIWTVLIGFLMVTSGCNVQAQVPPVPGVTTSRVQPPQIDAGSEPYSSESSPSSAATTELPSDAEATSASQVDSCTGKTVDVRPGTLNTVLADNEGGNLTLNLAPGTYPEFSVANFECIDLGCTVASAIDGVPNPGGCLVTATVNVTGSKNVIIEGMVFQMDATVPSPFNHDYGIAVYAGTNAIRIAKNAFNGKMFHDISTKEHVKYAEVLDNLFIKCAHHCVEIGQNGNVPSRPSTCGTMIVKGNIFDSPAESAITQRYNRKLVVEDNEFRDATRMVENIPFWAPFDPGTGPELNKVPAGPLRTIIRNNTFVDSVGSSNLLFESRGVVDDEVLVKGNTGPLTCEVLPMEQRVIDAHSNEQTTKPPTVSSGRDPVECQVIG
jgi:hypothetical protein